MDLKNETGAHITFINLSGGVGILPPEQPANDIAVIGEGVRRAYEEVLVPAGMDDVSICTELGRFMLAPYGHLVTKVLHQKHIYKEYIGVDACASNLMRPAIYGAYHHITVMGKEDAPCDHKYDVTGSLCENSDKFAIDRMLPEISIGDLLVIHDTGAHGHAMGYQYNGRLRSAEVLLCEDAPPVSSGGPRRRRITSPPRSGIKFLFSEFRRLGGEFLSAHGGKRNQRPGDGSDEHFVLIVAFPDPITRDALLNHSAKFPARKI